MKKYLYLVLLVLISTRSFAAEPDSLIFTNGNYIVGEVKSMQKGVLMMETPYSDKDFAIELEGIQEIYCKTYFLITLSDGRRYNGTINTVEPQKIKIVADGGEEVIIMLNDIVFMDDVDQGFWSQLYASIDIGFDLTKANNLRQVSMRNRIVCRIPSEQMEVLVSNITYPKTGILLHRLIFFQTLSKNSN